MRTLVSDMQAGKVDWLLILNANPVYTAPVDLHFEDAMNKVKTVVHLGSHLDETAVRRAMAYQQRALSGVMVRCPGL